MLFLRQLLEDFARSTSFSTDQVAYVFCLVLSLPLGYVYKTVFHPKKVSTAVRHFVGFIWGLALGWFCFEWQVFILVADVTVCYWLMNVIDPRNVHRYIFVVSMLVLTAAHLNRQITDYGGYKLDFTGPLMLITQKMTYMAFHLHDGLAREDEKLNHEQRKEKLKQVPSPLQYYSYMFHYSMLLAGPVCTFGEYKDFIDGSDVKPESPDQQEPSPLKAYQKIGANTSIATSYRNINSTASNRFENNRKAVCGKVMVSVVCLIGIFLAGEHFVIVHNGDPEFISTHLLTYRVFYAWCCVFFARLRYYFAFSLADAVNNMSGLGFNGYNSKGDPHWDRLSNVNILQIEFPLNVKMILDNWNITTALWLRRIVYDRVKSNGLAAVFVLSAVWHGFYPGYYLAFLTAGLMVQASRTVRRRCRSYFQDTPYKARLYDVLTCAVSILCLVYTTVPFVALELRLGWAFWRSTYFYGHILCLLGLTLPRVLKSQRVPAPVEKVTKQRETMLNGSVRHIDDVATNGGIVAS